MMIDNDDRYCRGCPENPTNRAPLLPIGERMTHFDNTVKGKFYFTWTFSFPF